ncbi:MAG: hypothetical protein IPK50_03055 [Fibrobacterota bacterium]|nr:hypothetical protein [Fibrobacterota bacterium]QQS05876.1 MAG: hypothetical protein IPK50_03055 [Fibrobacterota bacterium]
MIVPLFALLFPVATALSTQGDLVPLRWDSALVHVSPATFRQAGGRTLITGRDTFHLYKRGSDQQAILYLYARQGHNLVLQDSATLPTWYAHCPLRIHKDARGSRIWAEIVGDAGTGTLQLVELGIGIREGRLVQTHRLTRSYVLGELGTRQELQCKANPHNGQWSIGCALSSRTPRAKVRTVEVRFQAGPSGPAHVSPEGKSPSCLAQRIWQGHFLSDTIPLGSEPRENLLVGLAGTLECLEQ